MARPPEQEKREKIRREKMRRDKIRRAEEEIRKASREIRNLQTQLKAGTLDRRKLEAGLEELGETVGNIPTFRPFMPN